MLIKQRHVDRLFQSFSPYRIIACYALFYVVRVDCDSSADIGDRGIIHNDLLLRSASEQKSLADEICDTVGCESVFLDDVSHQHYSKDTFPIPIEEKENGNKEGTTYHDFQETSRGESNLQADSTLSRVSYDILTPLQVFSLTSNNIQNGVCRKHSRIFLHQLKRYRMWALQMFDASAKLPSGILRGNINQLGDFDECVGADSGVLPAHDGERVQGKYCLISVDVNINTKYVSSSDIESLREAIYLTQANGFITSKINDPGHFIPKFTTINWALCVPTSCSEHDVQNGFTHLLQNVNGTSGLQVSVNVETGMCYNNEDVGMLPPSALCVIFFYGLVILVTVVATIRDNSTYRTHNAGKLERSVMAFSLRKNLAVLLEDLPADGDIHCIHGIRALCTFALYVAHKVITLALVPYSNRVELTELSNHPLSSMLRASIVYTDTFLMLSGVLTAYHLTRELQRKGSINWLQRYLARFIRLTPALMVVVTFYAFVFEHIGRGPQWGRVVQQNANICKKNLWRNMLYMQNFYPFEEMCATHTHQLALDMQLSMLAPPVIYVLHVHPLVGTTLLLSLNVFSTGLRYAASLYNDLSLVIYHGMPVEQLFKTANMMYSLSIHRATPYVIGIGLGVFIRKTGKITHIPKLATFCFWLVAAIFAYYSLLSRSAEAQLDFSYNVNDASIYAAWAPVAWSLALAWLIYACFAGYGGVVNTFLSCRTLVVLSRISYAVYLTQFAVFFYNVGITRTSEQFTLLKGVDFGEMVVVFFLSVVVTLLFDLPMQDIKGILLHSGGSSRKTGSNLQKLKL